MNPQVLIISAKSDWSAARVTEQLDARDVHYSWLDPAEFPQRLALVAAFDAVWHVEVADAAGRVDLGAVLAVLYRRPADFVMPAGMSGPELRFARAQARVGLGGVLASLRARWMNHPSALADAEYKPRQLALAATVGLDTPRTLVTNDRAAVRTFAGEVGDVVVKPLAEPIVREAGGSTPVWTRRLTSADLEDLDGVETTAHLFQAFVTKAYEVRVTAVGDRLFAVRIDAGSPQARVDWRSDYDALTYQVVECPHPVAEGIRGYLAASGLVYGAFDFVVGPDGRWTFLECNGAGQWGWLAEECGLPIAEAIADELVGGAS